MEQIEIKERLLFTLLGIVFFLGGLYTAITGIAGERTYENMSVHWLDGWMAHVLRVVMAIVGLFIIYKELKGR